MDEMERDVVLTLRAAASLRHLAWTRTGSLNDRIVADLFPHLARLRSLELTGDTRTYSPWNLIARLPAPAPHVQCKAILRPWSTKGYALVPRDFGCAPSSSHPAPVASASVPASAPGQDQDQDKGLSLPQIASSEEELEDPTAVVRAERDMHQRLVQLQDQDRGLEEVSLIMPDRTWSEALPQLASRLGGHLARLEILCNHTSFLRDEHLRRIAYFTPLLRHLSLAGCKALSSAGFLPLLQAARGQLQSLTLESVQLVRLVLLLSSALLACLDSFFLSDLVLSCPVRLLPCHE